MKDYTKNSFDLGKITQGARLSDYQTSSQALFDNPPLLFAKANLKHEGLQRRLNDSWTRGKTTEALFASTMSNAGYTVTKSSTGEDIKAHIDFYIENEEGRFAVDVKGRRKLKKDDFPEDIDWVFLEVKNVAGNDGWLLGRADLIAFERDEGFVIVPRLELLEIAKKKCNLNDIAYKASAAQYRAYSRPNRQDLITLVHINDLKSCNYRFFSVDRT